MVIQRAVDFELHAFGDVYSSRFKLGVKVDAAVAIVFALEADRQPEILVRLFGAKIAVFLGDALAVNRAVLDGPFLVSHGSPVGQVLAVKETDPLFVGVGRAVPWAPVR